MTRACAKSEMERSPSPNSCPGDQSIFPSPDVSRRLPSDLLASVFIHMARDSYIDEIYIHATPTRPRWVNVSYVCHHWRDVALNCPTLWSYIHPMPQRWTEELLARSKMAPLKLSMQFIDRLFLRPCQVLRARLLSIVDKLMDHSQRIQELRIHFGTIASEDNYQILSKFLSSRLPCLRRLEISNFYLPEGKPWSLSEEDTPALRSLKLEYCRIPWYPLGPSLLTTLHLSNAEIFVHENTMADFLAILRRVPYLEQLSVHSSLPGALYFLSNGELDAIPTISLPHLSNMLIAGVPLSAATALLSCVDIPLRTEVNLCVRSEGVISANDYVQLVSLLAQRISQPDSPKFRSLTIGNLKFFELAFSTSEHLDPASSFSTRGNAVLKVIFNTVYFHIEDDYPVLSGICSVIPLTNIQSISFYGISLSLEFWRDVLALLSDVRHIRFSEDVMPNISSMLSLPSPHLMRNRQDDRTDRGESEIFVPALEELELYRITLSTVCGTGGPDPCPADVQGLYDAIATRKETRCRLTIKECHLVTDGGVKALESVGWWEGDQFRVTSNV